jgi:hypothetical protein
VNNIPTGGGRDFVRLITQDLYSRGSSAAWSPWRTPRQRIPGVAGVLRALAEPAGFLGGRRGRAISRRGHRRERVRPRRRAASGPGSHGHQIAYGLAVERRTIRVMRGEVRGEAASENPPCWPARAA